MKRLVVCLMVVVVAIGCSVSNRSINGNNNVTSEENQKVMFLGQFRPKEQRKHHDT